MSAPASAADAAADDQPAKNPVVARINGHDLHASDVQSEMQMMGADAQRMPIQMIYPQLLDQLVASELLSEKGFAEKLQNDPDVKKQLKEIEAQLVAKAYVFHTIRPKITDAKVKDVYQKEVVAKFVPEDEVRARHILIKVASDAKPEDVAKAEAEANDIIKQLKGGADFAKLASEKSADPGSAKQGGDLGYFAKGAMVKPFADAAFAMKVGDISDKPVKTDYGFHIIKVEDKRKSAPPPLSEVRTKIDNHIGQEMTMDLIKDLEAKAKIEKFNLDGTPMKAADASKPDAAQPDATGKP
jgi:peptidyl-prolyl cis-trans isomerase C